MKKAIALLAVAGIAGGAQAAVVINEVLGSTTSTDTEFIELYNTGGAAVDISGWSIELWDSDAGAAFGTPDAASPYVIPGGTLLAPGGYYLMSNATADAAFGVTGDFLLPANAIENSSYTMILKDAGLASVNSAFVWDSGVGDAANDAGTLITPDISFGPDGTFLPAGFYRVGDGSSTLAILEFDPIPAPSATPGYANLPAPSALALLGIAGIARRRR